MAIRGLTTERGYPIQDEDDLAQGLWRDLHGNLQHVSTMADETVGIVTGIYLSQIEHDVWEGRVLHYATKEVICDEILATLKHDPFWALLQGEYVKRGLTRELRWWEDRDYDLGQAWSEAYVESRLARGDTY